MDLDLVTLKVLALLLLVAVRLCVGLSPLYACRQHCRSSWVDFALAFSLSFAGGVLLATCFLHLLPQVNATLHYFLPDHTLAITELLLVAGFFCTFFLDEACVSFRSSNKVWPERRSSSASSSASDPPRFLHALTTRPHFVLRTLLLSLHALAEAASVGLADSSADLWFLWVASAVHGSVALASFTLHLLKLDEAPWLVACLSAVVVLFMVLGMVVGIVLTSVGLDPLVVAVLRGLAAGNILYVTFYELLTREVRSRALGLLSHFLALMGFLLMLSVQLFAGIHHLKYTSNSSSCLQQPSQEPDYEDNSYPENNDQQ